MTAIPGYEIDTELHKGRNSTIYRAHRETDHQSVIIKQVRADAEDLEAAGRLKREYDIGRQLNISNTVKTYGLEQSGSDYALILEDVLGITLEEFLDQARLDIETFLLLGISIAAALQELHERRVIHKDMNPRNIIINPETLSAKIIDLGISELLPEGVDALPCPASIEGSLAYISPEQTGRTQSKLDARADCYSLGITFYKMLAGDLPFADTDDTMALIHNHLAQAIRPVSESRPEVPPIISAIVSKLLAKAPDERYQTAGSLGADLTLCLKQFRLQGDISDFLLDSKNAAAKFAIPKDMFGSEAELQCLLASYQKLLNCTDSQTLLLSQFVLVDGDAGSGKSTLIKRFSAQVREQGGAFISGKYDDLQRGKPYFGLTQALAGFCDECLRQPNDVVQAWREKLQAALGKNGRLITNLVPKLALIIGDQEELESIAPTQKENRFLLVLHQLMQMLSIEKPLVICLQDMQWADSASIALLRNFATAKHHKVLFLLTYNKAELSEAHPANTLLEELVAQHQNTVQVVLKDLTIQQVTALVAASISSSAEYVAPLAELINKKTAGNLYFTCEFLKSLFLERILRFQAGIDGSQDLWVWDADAIKAKSATLNVVDLMVERFQEMPEAVQKVLQICACFGIYSPFCEVRDIRTQLTGNELSVSAFWGMLMPALSLGLISARALDDSQVAIGADVEPKNIRLKFGHDKILQSVYKSLQDSEAQEIHLSIARRLAKKVSVDPHAEQLYDLVNHYNKCVPLIDCDKERVDLIELNMAAGDKAKQSAAYSVAFGYYQAGVNQISEADWNTRYSLCFQLHCNFAEIAYLSTLFEIAESLYPALIARAKSSTDRIQVYQIHIQQAQQQGRYQEAISQCCLGLAELDVEVPETEGDLEKIVCAEIKDIDVFLEPQRIESLANNLLQDENKRLIMNLLPSLASNAFASSKLSLLAWAAAKMTSITLQHGAYTNSPYGLISYASNVIRGRQNDSKKAYEVGKLAAALAPQVSGTALQGLARQVYGYALIHWQRPFQESADEVKAAYELCLESGSLAIAAQTAYMYITDLIIAGRPLLEVRKEAEGFEDFIRRYNSAYYQGAFLPSALSTIDNLLGLTEHWDSFDSAEFKESEYLQSTKVELFKLRFVAAKIRAGFLYGRHEETLKWLESVTRIAESFGGMAIFPETYFYMGLNLAVICNTQKGDAAEAYTTTLVSYSAQMDEWAVGCAENYLAKAHLLRAEIARLKGEEEIALGEYVLAIKKAEGYGNLNTGAVANEVFAKYWLQLQQPDVAAVYLKRACCLFKSWDAQAKLDQMQETYGSLLTVGATSLVKNSSSRNTTWISNQQVLDISTIIKATRALSAEMDLSKLLDMLLKMLAQNAGAQRVVLLLKEGDIYKLVGDYDAEEEQIDLLSYQALESVDDLPQPILNFVKRSGELLVLGNAIDDDTYADDVYIKKEQVKSLLCMPIMVKSRQTGLIYLENRLTPNAFTADRLEILEILSSQSATSIENAALYSNLNELNQQLESRVAERTKQLEHAQNALVDKAHKAGMAEIAAGVLHNIGNVLNTINTSCSMMRSTLKESKVAGLAKANELIKRNRENLGHFLEQDPKGAKLVDYYFKLEQQIFQEVEELHQQTERMTYGIQTMKEVISAQQQYAKQNFFVENFSLVAVMDDAITLYENQLRKAGVQVLKECTNGREVKIHKSKLVHILVNLLKNAKEAVEANATDNRIIRCTVWGDDDFSYVRVSDTGTGVDAKNQKKLFSHGFTTKDDGHGFGLHSCANYMTEMGGKIWFDEPEQGYSTSFTLRIPARDEQTDSDENASDVA